MEDVDLDLGGRAHRVRVAGAGGVSVVFESAIGDVALTWALVQAEVSSFASTLAHDRPGLGASEPVTGGRTAAVMAEELGAVVSGYGLPPPYILVGHSFASMTVQILAERMGADVVGIVLVDGAHEDQMERFPRELDPRPLMEGFAAQLREMAGHAREGAEIPELVPPPPRFPSDLAEEYRDATSPTPIRLDTVAAEYEGLAESQGQVRSLVGLDPRFLGDTGLVVIRHGMALPVPGVDDEVNRRYEETWRELQAELASRSHAGIVVFAEGAGHNIHHDAPRLVAEKIGALVERAGD